MMVCGEESGSDQNLGCNRLFLATFNGRAASASGVLVESGLWKDADARVDKQLTTN